MKSTSVGVNIVHVESNNLWLKNTEPNTKWGLDNLTPYLPLPNNHTTDLHINKVCKLKKKFAYDEGSHTN